MRSFVFLVFKLISRAFTCPLVGTQASLLGILQLPEYFKNSGDCLIPKGSVLLHTFGKQLKNPINSVEESSLVSVAITLFLATFVIVKHMWTRTFRCYIHLLL